MVQLRRRKGPEQRNADLLQKKGFFPGLLTLDTKLTGLREAPEATAAWLPSEYLRMLTGEDRWRG